jgi:hypothetical protein
MYEDSGTYKPLLPDASYVIQNAEGQYYTGRAGHSPSFWHDHIWEAFKYTMEGANRRMADFPVAFQGCRITRPT